MPNNPEPEPEEAAALEALLNALPEVLKKWKHLYIKEALQLEEQAYIREEDVARLKKENCAYKEQLRLRTETIEQQTEIIARQTKTISQHEETIANHKAIIIRLEERSHSYREEIAHLKNRTLTRDVGQFKQEDLPCIHDLTQLYEDGGGAATTQQGGSGCQYKVPIPIPVPEVRSTELQTRQLKEAVRKHATDTPGSKVITAPPTAALAHATDHSDSASWGISASSSPLLPIPVPMSKRPQPEDTTSAATQSMQHRVSAPTPAPASVPGPSVAGLLGSAAPGDPDARNRPLTIASNPLGHMAKPIITPQRKRRLEHVTAAMPAAAAPGAAACNVLPATRPPPPTAPPTRMQPNFSTYLTEGEDAEHSSDPVMALYRDTFYGRDLQEFSERPRLKPTEKVHGPDVSPSQQTKKSTASTDSNGPPLPSSAPSLSTTSCKRSHLDLCSATADQSIRPTKRTHISAPQALLTGPIPAGPSPPEAQIERTPKSASSAPSITYTDDAATKLSSRIRRKCFNCHATDTPTWRRSSLAPGKVLCNSCGLFENTHSRPRPRTERPREKRRPAVKHGVASGTERNSPLSVDRLPAPTQTPPSAHSLHHRDPPTPQKPELRLGTAREPGAVNTEQQSNEPAHADAARASSFDMDMHASVDVVCW